MLKGRGVPAANDILREISDSLKSKRNKPAIVYRTKRSILIATTYYTTPELLPSYLPTFSSKLSFLYSPPPPSPPTHLYLLIPINSRSIKINSRLSRHTSRRRPYNPQRISPNSPNKNVLETGELTNYRLTNEPISALVTTPRCRVPKPT